MLNIHNHWENASQNYTETPSHSHPMGWLLSEEQKICIGDNVKKSEPSCIVDGNVGAAAVENRMGDPQKIKHKVTTRSRNSTSGYIHKRPEGRGSDGYLYTMFIAYIIHNSQKMESIQMFVDGK